MWCSPTLLQVGNEESPAPVSALQGGKRSSHLSAPGCETRAYRNWGERPEEIIKHMKFAARGEGQK